MDYQQLAKTIRFDNASKGFDPLDGGIERYFLLVISEICEAQDQLRDGRGVKEVWYDEDKGGITQEYKKPEGFPVEIADAIIRILDIQEKMNYTIVIMRGGYPFTEETIHAELLSIVMTVASCGQNSGMEREMNLNIALTGLLQMAVTLGIDINKVIEEKLAYNRTRPPKHGRKF